MSDERERRLMERISQLEEALKEAIELASECRDGYLMQGIIPDLERLEQILEGLR